MSKILLLEDDPNLGLILQEHLTMNGFDVVLCVDGQVGTEVFEKQKFDLCLVDIMMPRKDGISFVRDIRQKDNQTPIIFLTAKALKDDRIAGFKAGCDDYITKPFSAEELLLRIQAVLRRTGIGNTVNDFTQFEIGRYSFDSTTRILQHKKTEQKLTGKESELLRLLCQNMNQILERKTALIEIWGQDDYFSGRSMDVFISKLRKYLEKDQTVQILSIHGKGFRLITS